MRLKTYITSIVVLVGVAFLFTGCDIRNDILSIHKDLDQLAEDDEAIAQKIKVLTETVGALSAITDILQSGYYIKSVTPFKDEDGRSGNICSFTNGKEIRIYDGIDGYDGHTPDIGVKLLADGHYYWTLDGNLVLDDTGKPIRVSASPSQGETIGDAAGIIPQFTIKNGYWFISYDCGASWIQLGSACGEDGHDGKDGINNIITIDQSSEDYVSFVLKNGTVLSIPYYKVIRISFDIDDLETAIGERETIRIGYKLTAKDSGTYVSVSSDGFYTATSTQTSDLEGYILVTCPRAYSSGYINVIVYSSTGVSDMKVIRFIEKKMTFSEGLEFDVAREGGTVKIPFETNFNYYVQVEGSCSDWLSVVKTRGAEMISGEIQLQALPNTGIARSGIVNIYSDNGLEPFASIIVDQESAYCKADNGSYVVSYEGGTILSNLTTSVGVSMKVPQDGWVRGEIIRKDNPGEYYLAFTVDPNSSTESRTQVIEIFSEDGTIPLTTITLVQRGRNMDLEYSMIFIVRPNYSNNFTVYLPIDIYEHGSDRPLDCFVNWGDGTPGEHYQMSDRRWELSEDERGIHHHYEGIQDGKDFEVVVSGTVSSLTSEVIPDAYKSAIKEVKQWGKLGLKSMSGAFRRCTGLETLHPDETGAFSEVEDFYEAFYECPRLRTVSEHLFYYATKAKSFCSTFGGCSALVSIPENLFSNCVNVTTFDCTFSRNTALGSIPGKLFASCSKVEVFSGTFNGCRSLRQIPEELFWGCPQVQRFNKTFHGCNNIESIPASLFSHCTKATNFYCTFRDVYRLKSVPEHLFDNCPDIYTFCQTFCFCNDLKSVPTSLFDNQRNVVDFSDTFNSCRDITSESPYTVIDGKKVHLYERSEYPDSFVIPLQTHGCFSECQNMTDWDKVPSEWVY